MKKSRFAREQITRLRKQVEARAAVNDLGRKHGFSDASFYKCRSRFGGMDVADGRRLGKLERDNGKLKKRPAEALLDIKSLKVIARGKRYARGRGAIAGVVLRWGVVCTRCRVPRRRRGRCISSATVSSMFVR